MCMRLQVSKYNSQQSNHSLWHKIILSKFLVQWTGNNSLFNRTGGVEYHECRILCT